MRPLSSTEAKPLEFNPETGGKVRRFKAPTNKIGWMHTISDQPGTRFDITIKDVFGRIRLQKKDCGNDTEKYGELINFETQMGEDFEVVVDNVRGGKKVQLFLN